MIEKGPNDRPDATNMVSSVGIETVEFKTKLPLVGKVEIYL
jgi:hypothetical protein